MTGTTSSTELPVPHDALLELGLTEEQIAEAGAARPLIVAFQADQHPDAWYDVELVKRKLRALGKFRHTKGRWAGRPMRIGQGLDPWQIVWIIAPVFGWVYYDDEADRVVRVIRTAWIEVPRKNGKSTLSSGIGNVLLLADGEMGAEVYAAAGSREQAGRVFEDAKRMLQTSKAARSRVEPLSEVIRVPKTGGIFRALSRIAETAHGLNVSAGVIDEVHTLRLRRALVEAIETGTGARDQPLIVFITTADEAEDGTIYDEKHSYTRKIADNVIDDTAHYGVIWAAEKGDDPFAEATWRRANPGLGRSPTLAYMRREAKKAKSTPSYFPTFCRLHLNLRMRETTRWLSVTQWDAAAGMVDRATLEGRRAWGGLDLSAVSDLAAWWVGAESTQPGVDLEFLWRFYLPEECVDDLQRRLQVPLRTWAREGWLTLTEGDVIDYATIQKDVIADARHYNLRRIGYDRMFAGQLVQEVDGVLKGIEVVPISQTMLGLSPACKELERLLGITEKGAQRGRILHGGNPIARWMASCVEVKTDDNENMRPVKPVRGQSISRIDGIQACVTGLDGYLRRPKQKSRRMTVRR
jgi:phage terminase large subunit-like protein